MSTRFKVSSVTGYQINPGLAGGGGGSGRPPKRSFTVLDSAVCYRIMGEFISSPGSLGEIHNEKLARMLCDRLNAWDDEQ